MVKYFSDEAEVKLGDIVDTRIWFRRRRGQVVYVPGESPKNKYIDYGGLENVGIQIDNGPFVATLVDPDSKKLKKKVIFIRRGETLGLGPDNNPFAGEESSEE